MIAPYHRNTQSSMQAEVSRKQFLFFSLTSIGGALLSACSDGASTNDPIAASGAGGSGASQAGSGGTSGSAPTTAGTGTGGAGSANGGSAGAAGGSNTNAGSAGTSGGGSGNAGSSGSGGTGGAAASMCGQNLMVTSSGDGHTHTLSVPMSDILAGADKTYQTSTDANHSHWVKLTAADFGVLKQGQKVTKKTCNGGDHQYVLSCAESNPPAELPQCNDECGSMDDTCD